MVFGDLDGSPIYRFVSHFFTLDLKTHYLKSKLEKGKTTEFLNETDNICAFEAGI